MAGELIPVNCAPSLVKSTDLEGHWREGHDADTSNSSMQFGGWWFETFPTRCETEKVSLSIFFAVAFLHYSFFHIYFLLLLLFRKWVQKTSEAMIQFPKIHRKQISKTWRLRSLSTLNRFRIFHWAVTVFEEKCALMMGNNAIDWLEQVEEKDDLDNTWTVIGWSRLNHWDIKSCEPAGRSESFPAQSTVVEK